MVNFIKRATSISLIAISVMVVAGCAGKEAVNSGQTARQELNAAAAAKEQVVMDSFNVLMQEKNVPVPKVITFIDENITAVSRQNASMMIAGIEKLQQDQLPKLEEKFAAQEQAMQQVLARDYQKGLTENYINSIANQQVKALLLEAKNSGFKIETAEGMYFPVIDYALYSKYRNAVTPDIAAYIGIMAVESEKAPAKDAALIIGWTELLKRAAAQEQFIKEYSNSPKVPAMQQLLSRYASFALYGANNTPLFSYETKQMVTEAKKAYLETAFDAGNGSFSKTMSAYLAVLKQNDYMLTNQVQEYRNKAMQEYR